LSVIALLSLAALSLLKKLDPNWAEAAGSLSAGSAVANLGSSFLAAAAGGYVTAWMSESPLPYVLALGFIVLVLAGISAVQQRGNRPIVYLLGSVAMTPLGVFVGGLVRLRVMGVL